MAAMKNDFDQELWNEYGLYAVIMITVLSVVYVVIEFGAIVKAVIEGNGG